MLSGTHSGKSSHIQEGVEEILNLQPKTGGKAKPYQVKQVRQLIIKYRLGGQKRNDRKAFDSQVTDEVLQTV
jgi:hypothetical protein